MCFDRKSMKLSQHTQQQAKKIVSSGNFAEVGVDIYQVRSLTHPDKSYMVTVEREEVYCECKGYNYRRTCSHAEAIREVIKKQ